MKLTKELREFAIFEIKHYAKKMKIQAKDLPDLALEIIPNTSLGRGRGGGRRQSATKMFGVFFEENSAPGYQVADLLFLNVGGHPSRKALKYTIVHELVHLKHPRWKHGKKFNDLVESYIEV